MRPVGDAPFTVDAAKAARGREHFRASTIARRAISIDAPGRPAKPLAQLVARQPAGCLATKPAAHVPKFEITDRQRVVLLAGLQNQARVERAARRGRPDQAHDDDAELLRLPHARPARRRGRLAARLLSRASAKSISATKAASRRTSMKIGAKLQPGVDARSAAAKGGAVRPYMATRMPQFGEANVEHLPELFEKADARPDAEPEPNNFKDERRDAGEMGPQARRHRGPHVHRVPQFRRQQIARHSRASISRHAGRRLKCDWFRRYLIDPQSLRPGTRMPAFWPEGVSRAQGHPRRRRERADSRDLALLRAAEFHRSARRA